MPNPRVFLFIDNSNIFISAKEAVSRREGESERYMARMEFQNLASLAVANREIGKVVVVGSIPPEEKRVWEKMEQAFGVKPELYERGTETGGEQGLDQCLQVHMLRAISDNPDPQIVILMTGDGAGFTDGIGFHADLKRMHEAGWGIEVISWDLSCKKALKDWAKSVGVFIPLENYYESVTFIQDSRPARSIDLNNRPTAKIKKSPAQLAEERTRKEMQDQIDKLKKELEEAQSKKKEKDRKTDKYIRRMSRKKIT